MNSLFLQVENVCKLASQCIKDSPAKSVIKTGPSQLRDN